MAAPPVSAPPLAAPPETAPPVAAPPPAAATPIEAAPVYAGGIPPAAELPPQAPPRRRRPIGWIITVTLLALALIGLGVFLYLTLNKLQDANDLIDHQKDLIDQKDTFSASMQGLVDEAAGFDGVTVGQLVPQDTIALLAARGWKNRWDASAMTKVTAEVESLTSKLRQQLADAADAKSTNATKSVYETVADKLGSGFVTVAIDNADKLCRSDVLGCVTAAEPTTIHIDKADVGQPFMTDFIKQGIAYHEFAHVLQYTHPALSDETASAWFDNDYEVMADCFALTYLKGWKLHHTVFVNAYTYYEFDVGYGQVCDSDQKRAIREWYEGLAYSNPSVSQ